MQVPNLRGHGVQRREQLDELARSLLVHHLQRPLLADELLAVEQQSREHECEHGPAAALAVHDEHVVQAEGEPALPGAEEVVHHLHGEERASLVVARVVHDHDVVGGEDAAQQALLPEPVLLVAEVEDHEGGVREVAPELRDDAPDVVPVPLVVEDIGGEARIEHVDALGDLEEPVGGLAVEELAEERHAAAAGSSGPDPSAREGVEGNAPLGAARVCGR